MNSQREIASFYWIHDLMTRRSRGVSCLGSQGGYGRSDLFELVMALSLFGGEKIPKVVGRTKSHVAVRFPQGIPLVKESRQEEVQVAGGKDLGGLKTRKARYSRKGIRKGRGKGSIIARKRRRETRASASLADSTGTLSRLVSELSDLLSVSEGFSFLTERTRKALARDPETGSLRVVFDEHTGARRYVTMKAEARVDMLLGTIARVKRAVSRKKLAIPGALAQKSVGRKPNPRTRGTSRGRGK